MISEEKIARINELARKSRTEQGLTDAERTEQKNLRREYVDAVKQSLQGQLDHTVVVGKDGKRRKLSRRE